MTNSQKTADTKDKNSETVNLDLGERIKSVLPDSLVLYPIDFNNDSTCSPSSFEIKNTIGDSIDFDVDNLSYRIAFVGADIPENYFQGLPKEMVHTISITAEKMDTDFLKELVKEFEEWVKPKQV